MKVGEFSATKTASAWTCCTMTIQQLNCHKQPEPITDIGKIMSSASVETIFSTANSGYVKFLHAFSIAHESSYLIKEIYRNI